MQTVSSSDGTTIACDRYGQGPPMIMVVGAFNTRSTTAPLASALQERFTILNYDQRGRGDSGDTPPYAVDREVEDLDAVIAAAGGSSAVFGYSSGTILTLKAAARGWRSPSWRSTSRPSWSTTAVQDRPRTSRAAGRPDRRRRTDAVELYQTKMVGIPEDVVAQLRHTPFRQALEAIAHTPAYGATIIGDLTLPAELPASIATPTLVIDGEQSPPMLRSGAQAVADTLQNGRRRTLSGQTHDINPGITAAVLEEFLSS